MNNPFGALTGEERAIFTLRSLYARYGYQPYRMSKFEEYDLYVRNKDFLVSDGVITFNDTTGRLMALKPDVTLSIIKNTRDGDGSLCRLYYDENVYRVSKSSGSFRELRQVGLECVGEVGSQNVGESLWLAASSLAALGGEFVLDVFHLGLSEAALALFPEESRNAVLGCFSEKNAHELAALASDCGLAEKDADALRSLVSLSGSPRDVMPRLRELAKQLGAADKAEELAAVLEVFDGSELGERVRIDSSVLGNMKYYNGVVFKGFLRGIPGSVLSGGQYDRLMTRMHRSARAVGFAVYLDELEALTGERSPYDADVLLLCPASASPALVRAAEEKLIGEGYSVFAAHIPDPNLRVRRTAELGENGEVIFRG